MQVSLESVQEVEYAVLCELDRICKKYGIPYYLGQGTLLGAAKYKGFIPWDDDVDVLIPYDALKRLHEIFPNEAGSKYLLTNYKVEKYMPLSWSKIRVVDTLSRPKQYKDIPINWGICIDLFPIYPISDLKLLRKAEEFLFRAANKIIMAEWTKYEEGRGVFERLLEKTPLALRHAVMNVAVHLLGMHGNDSEYVLLPCKRIKVIKRDIIFGEPKTLPFETGVFPVPTEYHTYLTVTYGDYMAPLPKSEQRGHDLKMGEIEWRI